MGKRDTQRQRVYNAERPLRGVTFTSMQEVLTYTEKVIRSPWWANHSNHQGPVTVVQRNHSRGKAWYRSGLITLPKFAWFERYLLHELAHLAHGVPAWTEAGHGDRFVAVLHDMIEEFMGKDAAVTYRRSCLAHGVAGRLPVSAEDQQSRQATHVKYEECYRRYVRGLRATPPQLRKGMTRAQAEAIRKRVNAEERMPF